MGRGRLAGPMVRRAMHQGLLPAQAAALLLGGCLGFGGPGGPGTGLEVHGWTYTDHACGDDVPFTFGVRNNSPQVARNITAAVTADGFPSYTVQVGDLAPGASAPVAGSLRARDRCGEADVLDVLVLARAEGGEPATFRIAITI